MNASYRIPLLIRTMIMTLALGASLRTAAAGLDDVYWSPVDLAVAWYDGAATGTLQTNASGYVSQWNDGSINANHLIQSDPAERPQTGITNINGVSAVAFDGTSDDMDFTSGVAMQDKMAFFVLVTDSTGQQQLENNGNVVQTRFQISAGSHITFAGSQQTGNYNSPQTTSFTFATNTPTLMGWAYDTDNLKTMKNGSWDVRGARSAGANSIITARFGAYSGTSAHFNGVLGEYIITPILSDADRQKIEGYLAWKWELQGSLPINHLYKNEPPGKPKAGTLFVFE